MGERPYCSKHQRYLRNDGSCIDCQAVDLALSYAKDIVNAWPNVSFRTLRSLNDKMESLKQALEMLKR